MGIENKQNIKFPLASEAAIEPGVPRFQDNTSIAVITTPDGQTRTFAFLEDLTPTQGGPTPLFKDGESPRRIGDVNTELLYEVDENYVGLQVYIQGKKATNGVDIIETGAKTFKIVFSGLLGNLPLGPEDKGYAFKAYYRYVAP